MSEPWAGFPVFLIGAVYAFVGHGGGSGYLTVLAGLWGGPGPHVATAALLLNVLVAGMGWRIFWREGCGSWKWMGWLLAGSVPAAFVGASLPVPPALYRGLLVVALLGAGIRLALVRHVAPASCRIPPAWVRLGIGGAVGFLSGLIGIGGGVFLSPLMILGRWTDARTTAGISAAFIAVNSLSGLLARGMHHALVIDERLPWLAVAAGLGGWMGARLGAQRASGLALCRALGLVLVTASLKWIR